MSLPLTYSPAEVAKSYGASVDKVVGWIRSGRLTAINIGNGGVKPRWRIRESDLAEFEQSRLSQAPAKPARRRRKPEGVTEYF